MRRKTRWGQDDEDDEEEERRGRLLSSSSFANVRYRSNRQLRFRVLCERVEVGPVRERSLRLGWKKVERRERKSINRSPGWWGSSAGLEVWDVVFVAKVINLRTCDRMDVSLCVWDEDRRNADREQC
ncbi:hypothetical protein R1sor_002081 [Riccia sorocarpa]|uniref:Uncharacterized protein n=1 Tax=Riccia sorocarpa TaxID=122646 RepID=A0ABD3H0H1_9MARC